MVSCDSQGPGKYGWPPSMVTGYSPARNNKTNIEETSPSGGPAWRIRCCVSAPGDESMNPSRQYFLSRIITLCNYYSLLRYSHEQRPLDCHRPEFGTSIASQR